ncbi:MAG: cupin domain-containing protein [Methanosarcina sp.]
MAENHSKAVRDLIPEIIRKSGRKCVVDRLSDSLFLPELENKLKEEIKEYFESKAPEELIDLLEIIYRIAELKGISKEEFEALKLQKKCEKGGFEKNLLLLTSSFEKTSFPNLDYINPNSIDIDSINSTSSITNSTFVGSVYSSSPSEPVEKKNSSNFSSINPSDSNPYVFKFENASVIEKHGVLMRIYTTKDDCKNAAILYQETERGHLEEFLHEKSDFIYFILEGKGVWIIEDREFEVKAGDVIVVPAGKRFWFRGNLKQICITAPAWEEKYECHIRDIEL